MIDEARIEQLKKTPGYRAYLQQEWQATQTMLYWEHRCIPVTWSTIHYLEAKRQKLADAMRDLEEIE